MPKARNTSRFALATDSQSSTLHPAVIARSRRFASTLRATASCSKSEMNPRFTRTGTIRQRESLTSSQGRIFSDLRLNQTRTPRPGWHSTPGQYPLPAHERVQPRCWQEAETIKGSVRRATAPSSSRRFVRRRWLRTQRRDELSDRALAEQPVEPLRPPGRLRTPP